jgi:tRNA (uracil-5-)-methyltransferase TRM9
MDEAQRLSLMTSNEPQPGSELYEDTHVHQVYEQIASHFSSTRYKPWPIVEWFLKELPDGAIGLDVGCGNGKYLTVNPKIFIVASDRSTNLVNIASQHRPHTSIIADNLNLPHPSSTFDFAISIAVIHHLSTPGRRIQAVTAILDSLRPSTKSESSGYQQDGGKALIYVWALEQKHSRRGWDEGDEQDVMVPWVFKQNTNAKRTEESKTFHRYYHLYCQGELEHNIIAAGGLILESGYEKDNWWAIAIRKPQWGHRG